MTVCLMSPRRPVSIARNGSGGDTGYVSPNEPNEYLRTVIVAEFGVHLWGSMTALVLGCARVSDVLTLFMEKLLAGRDRDEHVPTPAPGSEKAILNRSCDNGGRAFEQGRSLIQSEPGTRPDEAFDFSRAHLPNHGDTRRPGPCFAIHADPGRATSARRHAPRLRRARRARHVDRWIRLCRFSGPWL